MRWKIMFLNLHNKQNFSPACCDGGMLSVDGYKKLV